jgi:hypothetical protein
MSIGGLAVIVPVGEGSTLPGDLLSNNMKKKGIPFTLFRIYVVLAYFLVIVIRDFR